MTVKRMDNVGIVVEDLDAAVEFFTELGLTLEGRMPIEGEWAGRVTGVRGQRVEIAMMRTPDGHSRLELSRFDAPAIASDHRTAPVNSLGYLRVMFTVQDIDDTLARLSKLGATVVDEVVDYQDVYRLCYIRGPEGILVGLAQQLGQQTFRPSTPPGRKPAKRTAVGGETATPLRESMVTGKASSAKAAVGDKPVFDYIASLPQPQRGIAERVDALAVRTLPGLQRSVKWGMSYYGVGDGWCFCCGGFVGHVKLMFINGAALKPVPPVTPVAMGKSTRGVELKSVDEIDERQIAAWMKQAAAVPGVGGKKR